MSELTPLTKSSGGQETAIISGAEVVVDDGTWQYVMIFPMVVKNDKNGVEKMPDGGEWSGKKADPVKSAKKIFKDRVWTGEKVKDKFREGMTNLEFHEAVRDEIARILASVRCGFRLEVEVSVDRDEKLLKIQMEQPDTIKKIADRQEIRMPVKPEKYPDLDEDGKALPPGQKGFEQGCPTMQYKAGYFLPRGQNNLAFPMYMRYDRSKEHLFGEFRETDIIRMIRKRMNEFFSLADLEGSGVVTQMYPVHHYAQKKKFEDMNWSKLSLCSWLSWPGGGEIDDVRNYFGEEVAFFFHWMQFYTRWMMVPGLIGFPLFFRRFLLPLDQQRYCQIGFCLMMIMWAALFTSNYTVRSNLKILQWGMQNFDQVAAVRKEFKKEKRGSIHETIQNSVHWILAVIFMIETVAAVAAINRFRIQAAALEEDEMIMGLSAGMAVKAGKYMITANIKLVDFLWAKMSPLLTGKENWRTDQQLKNAMVTKLFMVKFVVYYYPFYYIAFLKEHIEGCEEGGPRGCLPMLVENLVIFFATHICTTAANLVVPMVLTRMKISGEIKAAKEKNKNAQYTYLQQQAKCPPYLGDTQDFMELVLALGFVMMFSVALPVMATLSLITNLMEMKFLAFRMMNVQQRSEPRGQEGIGAWANIIKTVSYVAVMANAGMACFVMHPIKDKPLQQRLAIFVFVEHIAFFSMFLIQASIPLKGTLQTVIEERNGDLVDEVSGDVDSKIEVATTAEPDLKANK